MVVYLDLDDKTVQLLESWRKQHKLKNHNDEIIHLMKIRGVFKELGIKEPKL